MGYAIVDLELTEPLPDLALGSAEDGAFFLLRVHDRPVHYAMHPVRPGARLTAGELAQLLGGLAAEAFLEHVLWEQLRPSVEPRPVDLTVAICTRARPALLEICLRNLLALLPSESGDHRHFDVLVVDNDPPDDATKRLVAKMNGVRYAREPRAGLDFARNRAIAESRGVWTAFIDDDVTVDRGWLAGLEEAIAEHPDAASVTGLVLPLELATDAQIMFERRGGFGRGCRKLRFVAPAGPDNPLFPLGAGIFGAGCNMVLRTEAVRSLRGFDEALDTGPPLPGGGDLDIWSRLARAGLPLVYEPRMLVFHRHRRDHASLRRQYWSWGEGFMAYLTKTALLDPRERLKAVRLVVWWLGYQRRTVAESARRRGQVSPDLALAELFGGLQGLGGSYWRSQRRVARIRATHA
jgi:glycosyltransferase involved in cell wall biosynthesis